MNITEKLNEFNSNVKDLVEKEYNQIETEIESEMRDTLNQELERYEDKKKLMHEKYIKKIEKDYNKKIFNFELNLKKELIEEEEKLKESLKESAKKILVEYTKSKDYERFLISNILEALSFVDSKEKSLIGLTKKDLQLDKKIIVNKYNVDFFEISDKYIGGCILKNDITGIYIDNTIFNNVNEQINNLDM